MRKALLWVLGVLVVFAVIGHFTSGGSGPPLGSPGPKPLYGGEVASDGGGVPSSTAGARASASADMSAYGRAISPDIQGAADGLTGLTDLTSRASKTPSLMTDGSWRSEMASTLGELKAVGRDLQKKRAVPAPLAHVDALLTTVGGDLNYVADETAAGLDNMDASRLRSAATRLISVSTEIQQANTELRAAIAAQ